MPVIPSTYTPVSRTSKPSYLESYPSSYDISSGGRSDYSLPRYNTPHWSSTTLDSPNLPPSISGYHRRYTPLGTTGLDVPRDRTPVSFQPRPLRSISVLSDSSRSSLGRSPSPTPTPSYRSPYTSTTLPSKRYYPKPYHSNYSDDDDDDDNIADKDDAPVVFDANLTFVLGTKGKLKQNVTTVPAPRETNPPPDALTNKISNFLQRTDHVMDEWKRMGRKDDDRNARPRNPADKISGRTRSATNIMIKGYQLFSRANSISSRNSGAKEASEDCNTEAEIDEVGIVDRLKDNKTALS